jgi:hypothetical protein
MRHPSHPPTESSPWVLRPHDMALTPMLGPGAARDLAVATGGHFTSAAMSRPFVADARHSCTRG